mmetsp:Transcript_35896/g.86406  ORF Transcript_35896/g.86406 Transcript_35896/m.86406 type:complete len:465 (+) Transcript_35896:99-1493(+)
MVAEYGSVELPAASEDLWWPVVLIRFVTCVTALADGYELSIIGVAIVSMVEDLGLQNWQVSLIVSAVAVGGLVGAFGAGHLADAVGRLWTLVLVNGLLLLASVFLAFSRDFWWILWARLVLGLAVGGGLATVSVYLAEVSPKHARGFAVSTEEVFINVGLVMGFLTGWLLFGRSWQGFTDWQLMFLVGAIFPFVVVVVLLTGIVPESPRYYMITDREEDARRVLLMVCSREETEEALEQMRSAPMVVLQWSEVIASGDSKRRQMLVAAVVVTCCAALAGVMVVTAYGITMLSNVMSKRDAVSTFVFLSVAKLIATLIGCLLFTSMFQRRHLLLGSHSGMSLALAMFVFFYVQGNGVGCAVALGLFYIAFALGAGPLLFLYSPEVLDNAMRSKGSTLAFGLNRGLIMLQLLLFPFIAIQVAISICAACCACSVPVIYGIAPETKDVALEATASLFVEEKKEVVAA